MNPNYEEYTLEELEDVEAHIDRALYPERYKTICILIAKIQKGEHIPILKEESNSKFDLAILVPKICPKYKLFLQFIFVFSCYAWFFISQLLLSNQSIEGFLVGLLIYSLFVHWSYAYIFNTSMITKGPSIKPNEYKTTRLCAFLTSIALGIYLTYPRVF